jgi:hypothetical protein
MKCKDLNVDLCYRCLYNSNTIDCWTKYWFNRLHKNILNKEEIKNILICQSNNNDNYINDYFKYISAIINNCFPQYITLLNTIKLLK